MSIPQPRRTKSSIALRDQAASQRPLKPPPPLPSNFSSISLTPSLSSDTSTRSASTSSSGLRTPPPQYSRPTTFRSPRKDERDRTQALGLTEQLKLITSELESYVEEAETSDDNVHVAVRLKPNFNKEREVWTADPLRGYIGAKLGEFFFVDYVYTGEDTNYGVYDASVKKLVRKTVDGYNGTVFAYGQTSSGKTHTMRGHMDEAGIIPLAVADLFEEISTHRDREFTLKVTYLEIYNEKIRDLLLDPNIPQPVEIKLQMEKNGLVKATPLTECKLSKPEDMQLLLLRGDAARMTAATEFNNVSSRSHAVMQITIESRDRSRRVRTSTLSMIDLAGSERASTQEMRRKEGAYINKSLLTLGTVISRLTKPNAGPTTPTTHSTPTTSQANHIPYRDSKLTRLLQPSLSGGGYITILATICGGQKHSVETLSTLQFARRAKKIPAKALQAESLLEEGFEGEVELRDLLANYKSQVEDLKNQLAVEQSRKGNEEELNELKLQREQLNNRIERLSVLALAAGDSNNPIVQQTITTLESELSTRYDYCEILENKVETLKREKRNEIREWRKKVEERDRVIADLMAQMGMRGGGVTTSLPGIDTKVTSSAGSSPVSAGAASYLRSFNPFGRG